MKVSELAAHFDVKISDIQLEGRLAGFRLLQPGSQLAKYQVEAITKRLIQRGLRRRPTLTRTPEPPREASEFTGYSKVQQRVMAFMDQPPNAHPNHDVALINLRLLREGLGLSLETGAAVLGVEPANLQRYESDTAVPAWQIRDLLSGYAVHLAAWWGFEALQLDARTFEDVRRGAPRKGVTASVDKVITPPSPRPKRPRIPQPFRPR